MVVVVDFKMGNPGSILNMFKKIGIQAIRSEEAKDIEAADQIVLPGVGAFDSGMRNLKETGLIPVLEEKVLRGKTPLLGICLGMQLLTRKSEEGSQAGLGWVDADTVRFSFQNKSEKALKVPQMGWNYVNVSAGEPLFSDLENGSRFYFVHAYHLRCQNEEDIAARATYGYSFPCAVRRGNIHGVQFHPEKSHRYGMQLFKNFVGLAG